MVCFFQSFSPFIPQNDKATTIAVSDVFPNAFTVYVEEIDLKPKQKNVLEGIYCKIARI